MTDNEAKDRHKSMTQVNGSECGEGVAIEQQPIQAHQHLQNHHEQLYEQNWTLYIYAQSQFTYYEMMQASEAQMMPCE